MSEPAFGEILRRGREKAKISQARLADLVGRSPSTIRAWEHGRSRPNDRSYVKAIAAVLGLDETDLMEAAGFDPPDGARFRPTIEQELASLVSEKTVMVPLPRPVASAPLLDEIDLQTETEVATKVDPPEPKPASNGRRKVTTLPPPAPVYVQSVSYIEDREEKEFYWRRWALTAVSVLFMTVVFMWAFRQTGSALGDLIGEFFGAFNI